MSGGDKQRTGAPKKRKLVEMEPAAAAEEKEKEKEQKTSPNEEEEPASKETEASEGKERSQSDIDMLIMEKNERRKFKKQQKKLRENENDPEIELKLEGHSGAVKIKDIKDLVLWILADGVNPKWIMIKRKFNVKSVVVLMASELSKDLYEQEENFPKIKGIFSLMCDVQSPGEKRRLASPIQGLLQHQLSKEEKKVHAPENLPSSSSPKKHSAQGIIEELMLSSAVMAEHRYPAEDSPESAGFVQFTASPQLTKHKLLAIDCEMVTTKNGLELGRVSVVDSNLEVVYDTFCIPDDPILNYNTQYSGLTAKILEGVEKKLKEVQEHLATLISPETVLIGHSLENDLRALKVIHHNVIDTALCYSHTRGPPYKPSLKWLTEKFLSKSIQGEEAGHDSIEDAASAMELVNMKLKNGLNFGLLHQDSIRLSLKLEANRRTSAIVDTKTIVGTYGQAPAEGKICTSDAEVVEGMADFSRSKHFVYGRFTALEVFNRNEHEDSTLNTKTLQDVLHELDDNVAKVYQSLPTNSVMILLSGQGKVAFARQLLAKKDRVKKEGGEKEADKPEENGEEDLGDPVDATSSSSAQESDQGKKNENTWTKKDEQMLEEAIKVGRQGLGFFVVKAAEQ